jgi:two-component system sensor histidine kinase NblS
VRGILDKHDARVQIVSEPGCGTTFWFDLPLEQADEDELLMRTQRRESSLVA